MQQVSANKTTINWKAAGYTHKFKYERHNPDYGWVEGSFHVVPDSYNLHLNSLQNDKKVRNIQIVEL